MVDKNLKKRALSSFFWKFVERSGYYAVQFVVQLVLARILAPSDFGAIAIVIAFVNVLNVFVQSGLNTALIQAKTVSDLDRSTVFWISLAISVACYLVIFVTAPLISDYYDIDYLSQLLRFMSLLLFINAFNSVQVALVMRELKTRLLMQATLASCVISGSVGIMMAVLGGGVWALAIQQIVYQLASCVVLSVHVKWHPRIAFSATRAKTLFSFSWKLLVSSLLDTVYQGGYDLAIGKAFSSSQLGYYSQGKKLPSTLCTLFDNATKTVLLSVASKVQDDHAAIKALTRRAMMLSTYAVAPIMTILVLLAEPLTVVLFGEKWLPAVPFMQLTCVYYAFWPVHTSNLQSLNAIGRSDIYLRLEVIKKAIGISILVVTLYFTGDLYIVVAGRVLGSLLSILVNSHPAKRLLGYTFSEQAKDIAPAYLVSVAAGTISMVPTFFLEHNAVIYIAQGMLFILAFLLISLVTKSEALRYIINELRQNRNKWSNPMGQGGNNR